MLPLEAQGVMDAILRYLNLYNEADLPFMPKYHFMVHLGQQCLRLGSPICLATWHDKSLNAQLSKISAAAHPMVFERRVLATFNSCDVTMPSSSSNKPSKRGRE